MKRCALLLLIACTHSRVEQHDASAEMHETLQANTDQRVDETVQQGPETITTYEFAPPSVDDVAPPVVGAVAPVAGRVVDVAQHRQTVAAVANREAEEGDDGFQHADGLPPHGALIKVTVDQRGSVTEETRSEAATASTAALAATVASHDSVTTKTSWWPPWWVWLVGAVVLVAAIAGAGVAAWRLKPPWLSWLWKLLKVAT